MSDRLPPLYPWPLEQLLDRAAAEFTLHREIFGLQSRRFFKMDPAVELGCALGGRTVATPVGPAAGPHTQLAQNIALGWLAGARSFELKTVQILDELDIERPCIEMENVGYNIEWSQELTLEQSLDEYVKSWLLLAVLRQWEPVASLVGDPGDHAFELSVGYDLAGIRHGRMADLIRELTAAGDRIDAMRSGITGPFAALRDVPAADRIVGHATLSTFHGCPPDEIEGIVKHLMTEHALDVTVKLNPTLLGPAAVASILHERLGYTEVKLVQDAFDQDLKFDRALALIENLTRFATDCGREFGIKLTNTLVVANDRGIMPGPRMYLSGKPLHVLAMTLLDRLVDALPGHFRLGGEPGPVPVAFSAGIDKDNLTEAVALGLRPVTICSDLLKPGGYGRMAQGLRKLVKTMKASGQTSLTDLVTATSAAARTAGHRDAVAAMAARLSVPDGWTRYSREATAKPLRQVDNVLAMFECVACTNCVTVCPNDAFLSVPSGGVEGLQAKAQYLLVAEWCNECGNCTTFCPEEGAPHLVKPRLYTDVEAWREHGAKDFLVTSTPTAGCRVSGGPGPEASARVRALIAAETWLTKKKPG
jgi:putative selenate reductase